MTATVDSPAISSFALIPFVLMLGAIAVAPLASPHFWDKNRNKLIIALSLSIPAIIYMLRCGAAASIFDTLIFDYVPFITLLGTLFIITGGIFTDIRGGGTPRANTLLLGIGALLASVLGTTGAAMLLIRPLLHMNRHREFKIHSVLFFIPIVCNCGGLLTPLGDPPLFMMYLRGVPFLWFLKLTPEWVTANIALLAIYFSLDMHFWLKEKSRTRLDCTTEKTDIEVSGRLNFIWLAGVIMAIAFINSSTIPFLETNRYSSFLREGAILLMAVCSLHFTPHMTRISNSFTWNPIIEVAVLFLGIFTTMVPCLLFLEKNAQAFSISSPVSFYYLSGLLSSFLDNTPTAVTFHSFAVGLGQQSADMVAGIPSTLMKAICTGSVFFGAMTYIGNGPNFMVKTIAEHQNVKMPHFFEYIFKFALPTLLPVFILIHLLFI